MATALNVLQEISFIIILVKEVAQKNISQMRHLQAIPFARSVEQGARHAVMKKKAIVSPALMDTLWIPIISVNNATHIVQNAQIKLYKHVLNAKRDFFCKVVDLGVREPAKLVNIKTIQTLKIMFVRAATSNATLAQEDPIISAKLAMKDTFLIPNCNHV